MMTVNEVSKLTGVSIRTLQYYDKIGLLRPAKYSESGYRLYDDTALEKLQQILLFRELEFPLKDIKIIMDSPDFDRSKALEQQIALLTLKKEHLEDLIRLARGIKLIEVNRLKNQRFFNRKFVPAAQSLQVMEGGMVIKMDFSAFDTSKIDEYAAQAKASWGNTPEYREYEEKAKDRTKQEEQAIGENMMKIFTEFGTMLDLQPDSEKVQAQVKKLKDYITENFYTCSNDILNSLGNMYAGGGDFTTNIDRAGGEGTAEFVSQAIEIYCRK